MAVTSTQLCHTMSDHIAELLRKRIRAGPDVMAYIDSVYGHLAAGQLQTVLDAQGCSERETLVELIFFPDESVQVLLERLLEELDCTMEDVATIATDLANRDIMATVALGDTGQTLNIRVDRSVIDPFLTRLNLTYRPDAGLNRTLVEVLPADTQRAVRVRLRNACYPPEADRLDVLQRYIRSTAGDEFFFEGLDFLLGFMQEIDCDEDVYRALARKKRRYWRELNKIKDFEQKLRKTNIETLLLQGERFPHIDRVQTMKSIALIDRICLAVFGRTEPVEAVDGGSAGWEFRGAQDAAAMFRRLNREEK